MNPAKRRRLDDTASTLSKPFRSPLKVTPRAQNAALDTSRNNADQQTPTKPSLSQTNTPAKSPTASEKKPAGTTEDLVVLQRQYAALGQQLRKLKQDLDATEQAWKIRSTNQEEKLNALIDKWQSVARDAADEVFEDAKSRVENMGGLRAWQRNATQDRSSDWSGTKDEHVSSDKVDMFGEDVNRGDVEREDEGRSEEGSEDDEEEQSFTMDTMLRQLNINPDLLNFDTKNEQWSI